MSEMVLEVMDQNGRIIALQNVRQSIVASENGGCVVGMCGTMPKAFKQDEHLLLIKAHRIHNKTWVEYSRPIAVKPDARYSVVVNRINAKHDEKPKNIGGLY